MAELRSLTASIQYGIALAVLALPIRPTSAQEQIQVFGSGGSTCKAWTSNPDTEPNVQGWIMGFWTGLNNFNDQNRMVGRTMDAARIVGEVYRECEDDQSRLLYIAVYNVYLRLMQDGR